MEYDVIKSTDQLMGIWGLGKVEKKDSDTKMIPHTKHSTPPAPVTASEGRQYHDVGGFGMAEMLIVPTPPPPWPQSGFLLTATHLRRGWTGNIKLTHAPNDRISRERSELAESDGSAIEKG